MKTKTKDFVSFPNHSLKLTILIAIVFLSGLLFARMPVTNYEIPKTNSSTIINHISQLSLCEFGYNIFPPAVHFTNIWTGNPYLAMNVYVTSAILDEMDLEAGDEIGVFDGDNCVGSVMLGGPIQSGEYLSIISSTDDPTTPEVDGFIEGHTITYRLWDSGNSNEVDRVTANYIQGPDAFSSQATVQIELSGTTTVTQEVEFTTGWNLFSLYMTPSNVNLLQILNPLVTANALLKAQGESGSAIEQLTGMGWINEIGDWSSTEGYYLKTSSDVTLTLTDPPIQLPIDIPLSNGWNIISYPVQTEQDAMEVLGGLMTSDQLVKVQNEAGDAMEKLPDPEGWVNNIGNFKPDEGYYIKTNASTTLTLNEPAIESPVAINAKSNGMKKDNNSISKAKHFIPNYTHNPYLAMNIYVKGASLSEGGTLSKGDEIGIFDGDVCVGSYILTGPMTSLVSMKAATDDPTTETKDGFKVGDKITYRFWLSSGSKEVSGYKVVYSVGDGTFSSQGTAVADFSNLEAVDQSKQSVIPKSYSLLQNYPNPFNPSTTIRYGIPSDSRVTIKIINIAGQEVATLVNSAQSSGYHEVNFNAGNLASGIYFYRISAISLDGKTNFVETKKLVLMK
jgi:Secretion system C-terminal sorting domain